MDQAAKEITRQLRLRDLGGVVIIDFIDLHFGSYVYPTFNVADSGICVGVFAYILWSMKQPATAARLRTLPGL